MREGTQLQYLEMLNYLIVLFCHTPPYQEIFEML